MDRLPGCLDDGARLSRRVRAAGQRAVRVAAAVPAVPRAVHSPWRRGRRRWSLLHLDLFVLLAFTSRWRSSTTRRSASRSRSSIRSCSTCWCGCSRSPSGRGRPGAPLGSRCPLVARHRDRLPGRVPGRPQRHELERDRCRLRGRDRRGQARPRQDAVRRIGRRQRLRRHLRPRQLLRLCARSCAIFGWSGSWDDLPAAHAAAIALRPADPVRAVLPRPARPRADARGSCSPTRGPLPVHAVRRSAPTATTRSWR